MKIIDLLNKIANGEKVPKKIKLKGYDYIFTLREDCAGYKWYGEEKTHKDIGDTICQNLEFVLSCEVEILDDEEKGLPEKLPYYSLEKIQKAKNEDEWREERISLLEKRVEDLHIKMNELIDYLEKQRKGE